MSLLKSKFAKIRPRDSRGFFIKLETHPSKEDRKKYDRNYYLLNREKVNKRITEWGRNNKDKRRIVKKKWAMANKDHIQMTRAQNYNL